LKGTFHIAEWEIQPQLNCVSRGTRSIHLEPKVMQVLVQLASQPNTVLSKEQLIHAVWPDTFVGDDVLTRSISELRRVFEDDARAPHFIQTIPKSGYRLMVPVSMDQELLAPVTTPAVAPPAEVPSIQAAVGKRWFVPGWIAWLTLAVIVFAGVVYRVVSRTHSESNLDDAYITVPLTSNLGAETQPAFSPDGNQVAYVWNGGSDGMQHLYVKLIGAETSLQLTSGTGNDISPTWSPDGRSIAFLRVSPSEGGIYVVAAIGGAARKLFTPVGKIEWDRGALSWSADGNRLIFPDGKSAKSPSAIYELNLTSMEVKQITSPSRLIDGDFGAVYSPDGSRIAFIRGTEGYVRDIYVMPASGGKPRRLTFDDRFVSGLTWTADGTAIVFSSNRGGMYSLWRISAGGGSPERLPVGGDDAFDPAISRQGNLLAYSQRSAKWSISQIGLNTAKPVPTRLLSSTQQDSAPQFSPDGSRIAFQSLRSGAQEIWACTSAGNDLVKLTSFGGPLTGSPSWSPDGQQIAFDSRPRAHSHIYVIEVTGGSPKEITEGGYNDIVPSWSHDGQWIYFGSNRSGVWQIWKVSSKGGTPQQVTTQGGFVASESADGKWVYYSKSDMAGLWRVPISGGAEEKVLSHPSIGYWGSWAIRGDEIFYLNSMPTAPALESFNVSSQRTTRIMSLQRVLPPVSGLTVSPDGRSLLYTDLTEAGSHITLVENFR